MVTGWRRAFCTSIPKEQRETVIPSSDKSQHQSNRSSISSHSPRISSKFGFFSNPSTPRLQTQPVSSSSLRCRTTTTTTTITTPNSSPPNSPRLQCKTPKKSISPRLFHFSSNPSSPKSPSSSSAFSLLKATLRPSKSRCGVCLQSVKSRQGTAIFTAECNHVFHFPCVAAHNLLICPVCNSTWKQLPSLSSTQIIPEVNKEYPAKVSTTVATKTSNNLRVYNDDEPLMSPSPGSYFNPIPELEENDEEEDQEVGEFQGFFVCHHPHHHHHQQQQQQPQPMRFPNQLRPGNNAKLVDVTLSPESAVVAAGRGYETQVVVLRVKATPPPPSMVHRRRRPPIDLVTVLDVSERMSGAKSQMMKRAMKVVVSTLGSADRLSIVAFSATSKRLLPLRRMTGTGRRAARRIIDAMGSTTSQGMSVSDAIKKAAKVIEDRREKNPVSTIIVLSNGHDDRSHGDHKRLPLAVSSTRFSHLEIPLHSIAFGDYGHAPSDDTLAKCLGGLLNMVVQDLRIQLGFVSGSAEIPGVYSVAGRPAVFGSGSVRVGDLLADEERELLVELKLPSSISSSSVGAHRILSVRSNYRDPFSQEVELCAEQALLLPRAQAVRSSGPGIQRLRNLHVSTRAVAESRRLVEHGDLSGAYHLLSSARALLLQKLSSDGSAGEYLLGLEVELAELNKRRQQQYVAGQGQGQRRRQQAGEAEKPSEPLTPTSAWRAAERLAKVAIMRKHMNRVSDLHGFENARF